MPTFERRTLLGSLVGLALTPLAFGRGLFAQLFRSGGASAAPRPQVNPPSQSVPRRG